MFTKKRKRDTCNKEVKLAKHLELNMDEPPEQTLLKSDMFRLPKGISCRFTYKKFLKLNHFASDVPEKSNVKCCANLCEERKEFRKYLLNIIRVKQTDGESSDGGIPNKEEKELLRYYYYINHGIDTIHIPPIKESSLRNILNKVPHRLKRRTTILNDLIADIKEHYEWNIKKSVIDFALQNPAEDVPLVLPISWTRFKNDCPLYKSYKLNQSAIVKNLFVTHSSSIRIRDLWLLQYRNLRILNIDEFKIAQTGVDLIQFQRDVDDQMHHCKDVLLSNWLPSICNIILKAARRKKILSNLTEKEEQHFYRTLFVLMTLQVQSLCLHTVIAFTDFICDVQDSPGFKISILYENNVIKFKPDYNEFACTFLNLYEKIIDVVTRIPSIQTKLFVKRIDHFPEVLKPVILPGIVENCRNRIKLVLENEWIVPELTIQDFDDFIFLINGEALCMVDDFLSKERTFDECKKIVMYYDTLSRELITVITYTITIGMFHINREHFIRILIEKARSIRDKLLSKISCDFQNICTRLNEEFEVVKDTVLKHPSNTDELVKLKEYCLKCGTVLLYQMEDCLRDAMRYILFLADYISNTRQQTKLNSIPFLWYRNIDRIFEKNRNMIQDKTYEFQQLLKKRIEEFNIDLSRYAKEVDEFQTYKDSSELQKYYKKAQALHKKLELASQRINDFNIEEDAFGWRRSFYPKHTEIMNKLEPYKKLYENCSEYKNKYQIWTQSKIGSFEPEEIESDVHTFHSNVKELNKQFAQISAPFILTNDIRQDIEVFQNHMAIVKTLGNPNLKDRHWEKISEVVGFPLRASKDLNLAKILDYGLEEYVPRFQVISHSATKENCLEIELSKMIAEWENIKFHIVLHKEIGAHVLSSANEIQALLDDHMIKTQLMKNSAYIKPFEVTIRWKTCSSTLSQHSLKVQHGPTLLTNNLQDTLKTAGQLGMTRSWEEKLTRLRDIIDVWYIVQHAWSHLEPIFTTPDVLHQIPEEARRFGAVDRIWKEIMAEIIANTEVMAVIEIDKIYDRFNKCNTLLDMIQRGLHDYLESKRLFFPRFYFLSDDEILEIISKTTDVKRVQPYLKKCFGGIGGISVNQFLDIYAIKSECGEEVQLSSTVDTVEACGQVEKCLFQLDAIIKPTLQQAIVKSEEAYYSKDFTSWAKEWPQQVVYVVWCIIYTKEIASMLPEKDKLTEYLCECSRRIEHFALLLRTKLDSKDRRVLAFLLLLDMFIRDVVSALINKSVTRISDFEWISTLRYYLQDEKVILKMLNISVSYGYEYLGDVSRLVMTNQLDLSLKKTFVAFQYHFGLNVMGASATGKTEMIKDIAKTFAKPCYVFNCSKYPDYLLFKKLIKGLVSCGAYVCFDDFDRMEVEGMSVIVHYTLRIHKALKSGVDKIEFDGVDFKFDKSGMMFATTCSATCIARNKLPNNMKTSFRSILTRTPDYVAILKTQLCFMGFVETNVLAEKIVSTLKICSKISNNHFYFSLRTIGHLLTIIEKIKTESEHLKEEQIIVQSVVRLLSSAFPLSSDRAVFQAILSNGFSEVASTPAELHECTIQNVCHRLNVKYCPNIFVKICELYSMIQVYTGIIIVGDAFSGKSTILKILAEVMKGSKLCNDVEICIINPNALPLEHLYGYHNKINNEWNDGVLSSYFRKFATSTNSNRKMLIFDGALDPIWIENLNTVFDDSKKLFLSSGETINIQSNTNLVFETDSIINISPSTISRCCIVVMEHSFLKWESLIHSWLNKFPSTVSEVNKTLVETMIYRFCYPLFHFFDQVSDRLIYPVSRCNIIQSLLNIYDCYMDEFQDQKYISTLSEIDVRAQLEGVFLFSCVWSFGALLSTEDKTLFDTIFRGLMTREISNYIKQQFQLPEDICKPVVKSYVYPIPDYGSVFDYYYVKQGKGMWKLWADSLITVSPIPRDILFHDIVVPTKMSVRTDFLISLLIQHEKPVMLAGDTATGKTVIIKDFIKNKLNKSLYKSIYMNFSPGTTGNSIQKFVTNKLQRRKKGVFGPPLGIKYLFYVDDIAYSSKDEFGTHSSIELLRHLIEYKKWYNISHGSIIQLEDLQLICSLTTVGIRNKHLISPRFTRHFNIIATDMADDDTLKSIFGKIMLWHLDTRGFSKEFDPCINQIVGATLAIHKLCAIHLLPIPSKLHYVLNLRDISRVVQGVVLSVPEAIEDLISMKRLWVHEVLRVYHDRLVDEADTKWLLSSIYLVSEEHLQQNMDDMFKNFTNDQQPQVNEFALRKLMFCDFTNPKADVRNYIEVRDINNLQSIVEGYLTEHNNMSKKPSQLVLSKYIIEHLSRLCRVLKQPHGHLLLVGMCGSGRHSVARLAVHICEYELFQIEVSREYDTNKWRSDLKSLLLSAYTDQHSTLLLSDCQIKEDTMIEDICNLMITGEIADIFNAEDRKEICEKMEVVDSQRDKILQTDGTAEALLDLFVERVQRQIHIMLVFDSYSSVFYKYIRKFPTLIKCCTLDWIKQWPSDALQDIAVILLRDVDISCGQRELVIKVLRYLYLSSEKFSNKVFADTSQVIPVSPRSYIKLVTCFKDLFIKKQSSSNYILENVKPELTKHSNIHCAIPPPEHVAGTVREILENKTELQRALHQLLVAEEQIPLLNKEILSLRPTVETKCAQVQQMESLLQNSKHFENQVVAAVNAAKMEKHSCEKNLEVARAEYELKLNEVELCWDGVVEILKSITPADVNALRSMKNPAKSVKLVVQAMAVIKEIKPEKRSDLNGGGKVIEEYWKPTVRLLADSKFVESLINFDKENVPSRSMKLFEEQFLSDEDFKEDKVRSHSIAAHGLYKWMISLYEYDQVVKMDSSLKMQIASAEESYESIKVEVAKKERELEDAQMKSKSVKQIYDKEKSELILLEEKERLCSVKKQRAEELSKVLSKEKISWPEELTNIQKQQFHLMGNMLLCAGLITYLGPYESQHRQQMIDKWSKQILQYDVPLTTTSSVFNILFSDVDVNNECSNSLPNNSFFIENALISRYSAHWSLMIDPQEIMNKWIKNIEGHDGMVVIKYESDDVFRILENAVHTGSHVLLENIGEYLDPVLYTVLKKQTFKTLSGTYIKVGDTTVEYNQNFRLYITTKLRRVNFPPEIYDQLTVINCDISSDSLHSFMLDLVIIKDRPSLETEKCDLTTRRMELLSSINDARSKMLKILALEEALLESESGVSIVVSCKLIMDDALKRIGDVVIAERSVASSRSVYNKVGTKLTCMYRVLENLINLCPAYNFSMQWFSSIVEMAINSTEQSGDFDNIIQTVTNILHKSVCRTLSEKDKMAFSFVLTLNFKFQLEGENLELLMFLFESNEGRQETICSDIPWLSYKSWTLLSRLSKFEAFHGILKDIGCESDTWKPMLLSNSESLCIPNPWNSKLNSFEKMILRKCVLGDNTTTIILDFMKEIMGSDFLNIPCFDVRLAYSDSECSKPVMLMIFDDSDPTTVILNFSRSMAVKYEDCILHSMLDTNDNGDFLNNLISKIEKQPLWVIIYDCSFNVDSVKEIQEMLVKVSIHSDFRLWILMDAHTFVLSDQDYKLGYEIPDSFPDNLYRLYTLEPVFNFNNKGGTEFKRILFTVCSFHTLIQHRGNIKYFGFNGTYSFNDLDLYVTLEIIQDIFKNHADLTSADLCQLIATFLYGTLVVDEHDQQYFEAIIKNLYELEAATPSTSAKNKLQIPSDGEYSKHLSYIRTLSADISLQPFGYNKNIASWQNRNRANIWLQRASLLIPGSQRRRNVQECSDILNKIEIILQDIPEEVYSYKNNLTKYYRINNILFRTIFLQEYLDIGKTLENMKKDLFLLDKCVKGNVYVSFELEMLTNCLKNNTVPSSWGSYKKPLDDFIKDSVCKFKFFQNWNFNNRNKMIYWLPAFSSIIKLLSSLLVEFPYLSNVLVQNTNLEFQVFSSEACVPESTKDGIFVSGIILENASWNFEKGWLEEEQQNNYMELPLILLTPSKFNTSGNFYKCPLYEVHGNLKYESLSANCTMTHVTTFSVLCSKSAEYFVKNGTRLICRLL